MKYNFKNLDFDGQIYEELRRELTTKSMPKSDDTELGFGVFVRSVSEFYLKHGSVDDGVLTMEYDVRVNLLIERHHDLEEASENAPIEIHLYKDKIWTIDLEVYLDESTAEFIEEEIDGYAQSEEFETTGYLTISYVL